jgi:hypothetical protein
MRTAPTEDATDATIAQVKRVSQLLPDSEAVPMFVSDAGYDPAGLTNGLAGTAAQVLVRVRSDRVFYTDVPTDSRPPGQAGRPRRHGQRFKLSPSLSVLVLPPEGD